MAAARLFSYFTIALLCIQAKSEQAPPQCIGGLIVDCLLEYEDVVWAVDSQDRCKVIMNRCIFNNNNCYKFRQGTPLLREVPKLECQKKCSNDCSQALKTPVCTKRNSNFCYFSSECDLEKHICNTGDVWTPELNRQCDSRGAESVCP